MQWANSEFFKDGRVNSKDNQVSFRELNRADDRSSTQHYHGFRQGHGTRVHTFLYLR